MLSFHTRPQSIAYKPVPGFGTNHALRFGSEASQPPKDTVELKASGAAPAPKIAYPPSSSYVITDPEAVKMLKAVAHMQTQEYHDKLKTLMTAAKAQLEQYLKTGKDPAKGVLVWDIDETILDNSANYIERWLSNVPAAKSYSDWTLSANAPAIPETLELFQWAHDKGFQQVFITSRKQYRLAATKKNLTKVGITPKMYQDIRLKPKDYQGTSEAFKADVRKELEVKGLEILLVIGDQASDVAGVEPNKAVKLPNDLYDVA